MNEYIAITKKAIIENTVTEFDLFLKSYVNGRTRYVLFSRGNEEFTPERKEELLGKNVQEFYISTKDTDKYLRYQEKNLKHIVEDCNKSTNEISGALYQVASNLTQDILNEPTSGNNIQRTSEWVNNTISHIVQNENTLTSLFEVTSHDYQTYTHSINVSVIGLLFGKYLSLKPHELNSLGKGLLLHDIGKVKLPPELIRKHENLTREEFNKIKKHPKAGFDLLEHNPNIDGLSLKVVIQHHENYDGSGYPYGIGGSDIHLFGHISRIIDAYDVMTSNRPSAAAMGPFATLAELKEKMPNCFNEELLKEFICFLGPKEHRNKAKAYDILHPHPTE
ncbi:MAG: HD-GYP domain-containing protein [Planctomycetota bacterium]|jgi:HD-GYP domain-containing protein (c-di-GMP phosphodiesterase class II)